MKDYKKRHLLLVCGTSPQIITETLFGLFQREGKNFIPTHVHVITTQHGAEKAQLSLLHPKKGQMHKLCQSYQLTQKITFTQKDIHIITNSDGQHLSDIQSPEDNEAAADFITSHVRSLTAQEHTCVYASLAGGRKTMGFYLGYAMSLFGREQDRLTHVLVSPVYENNPNFFFPTKESQIIYAYGDKNKPLDTQQGKVTLADIPFVRLRQELSPDSISLKLSFNEVIDLIQRNKSPLSLNFNWQSKELTASEIQITLPPSELAFYCWIANRKVKGLPPANIPHELEPNIQYAKEFSTVYQNIMGDMADTDKTLDALKLGMEKSYFQEKKSRVNKKIKKALGLSLAEQYLITKQGRRGNSTFSIPLPSSLITFNTRA